MQKFVLCSQTPLSSESLILMRNIFSVKYIQIQLYGSCIKVYVSLSFLALTFSLRESLEKNKKLKIKSNDQMHTVLVWLLDSVFLPPQCCIQSMLVHLFWISVCRMLHWNVSIFLNNKAVENCLREQIVLWDKTVCPVPILSPHICWNSCSNS